MHILGSSWIEKIKKEHIVAVILIGVLLMVIAWPTKKQDESVVSIPDLEEGTRSQNATEQRLEQLLGQIEGAGKVEVFISWKSDRELDQTVGGVLIVADGGDQPVVKNEIIEAIEALFDVEMHKIKIVRRKEGAS